MRVEILESGLLSSIQDLGRKNLRQFGIPESGAMDIWNTVLANRIVGNTAQSPIIEFSLKGGKLRFQDQALIALCGADMKAKLNEIDIDINESIHVKKDDVLELGYAVKGSRCYLAIQGNWKVEKVFDSASTYSAAGFGGLDGSLLKAGDIIEVENESILHVEPIPNEYFRYLGSKLELRFIAGPEWDQLPETQKDQFIKSTYSVEASSDRMGVRLQTDEAIIFDLKSMISSAVVPGMIQLTNSGKPIILMKDGQTIGGYPRLGCVIRTDLSRLAQLPPHGEVKFKLIEKDEALELYRLYSDQLAALFN